MTPAIDRTHDPALRSQVASANVPGHDFPIQNLPFGVFSTPATAPRLGVAIGDSILDLVAAYGAGLLGTLDPMIAASIAAPTLNPLMALGNQAAGLVRSRLSAALREGAPPLVLPLVPMAAAALHLPATIGDFTDFFTSLDHTLRGGRIRSPEKPLPDAFPWLPIAYHSRASSVRVSGEPVARPLGIRRDAAGAVALGPSGALDFELEFAAFVGPGNPLGQPIPLSRAADSLFGFCLLNDWSARDIQRFESAPLGPFLAKSLSTTISPWVVTAAALAPFRCALAPRPEGAPAPLPHLSDPADQAAGQFDIALEAWLRPPGGAAARIVATNIRNLYWTLAQMLTHHASNGCNLRPGDLLGTGSVSGPADDQRACLAEITESGRVPLRLADGTTRSFLEDGDEVAFTARAQRDGFVPIGFGDCRATVTPAPAWPE